MNNQEKIYTILGQSDFEEREFKLQDSDGNTYWVDIYSDGAFEPPLGADKDADTWRSWLNTFVGKKIFIERITPIKYFSGGKTYIIEND